MTMKAFVVSELWTDLHACTAAYLCALTCLNLVLCYPGTSATHQSVVFVPSSHHTVTVQITVGHMPSSSTMTVAQHTTRQGTAVASSERQPNEDD